MSDIEKAKAIIESFGVNGSATLQLFASDGQGVRPINDLLSEEQITSIEGMVIECLNHLIEENK